MTQSTREPILPGNPPRVLPSDACPSCGTMMKETEAPMKYRVNGEDVVVPDASHLRCPQCDEVVLRYDEARHLRERALETYRKEHSLLTSAEIRAIRERLGLTQAAFASLLRLGGNTVSRWESGRNVQTAAMDVLMRMIRDVPGNYEYLLQNAA